MFKLKSKSKQAEKLREVKWWGFNLQETFDRLSSSEKGLEDKQIKNKRAYCGNNELPQKEADGWLQVLWLQMKSAMVLVINIKKNN